MDSFLDALKRRKVPAAIAFLAVFVVGLSIVWTLPSVYRSEAIVLIERQISTDFVSTTVTGKVQERLQVIQQRALTSEKVLQVAESTGYAEYLRDKDSGILDEDINESLLLNLWIETEDVQVTEDRGGKSNSVVISFHVAFDSEKPELAKAIAEEVTALLLEENRGLRREQSGQVTAFLEQAEARMQGEIEKIENQLSGLKEESFQFLPDQVESVRREMAKREEELITVNGEISFLDVQMDQLTARLATTPKHVVTDGRGASVAIQDPKVRLQQARLELELALQSFTDSHPDVIALRQRIRELEAEIRRSGGRSAEDLTAPTNPDYIVLSQQLNASEAKLEAARARKAQIETLMQDYQVRLGSNPAVELRYNQLLRDLERAQTEYADIKSRLYEAQLAESLEAEQKGERFRVLAKPTLPREPVGPHRIPLSLLVLVLSLVSGSVAAFVGEVRDNTVKNSRELAALTGQKPLAVIPVIDLTNVG